MTNDDGGAPRLEPIVRAYEVQTTYGYYPEGTWGLASYAATLEVAILIATQFSDCRIVDPEGTVVWP